MDGDEQFGLKAVGTIVHGCRDAQDDGSMEDNALANQEVMLGECITLTDAEGAVVSGGGDNHSDTP